MAAYIIGSGAVSPQITFDEDQLGEPKSQVGNRLTCIEPDYSKWMDVKQLRRMSRVMKMGAVAAKLALKNADIEIPDAIITGTGLGCLDDTGTFLEKLVEYKEETLNPTPFIQSTHNTIGSHIAFLLQCLSYNQTYSHGAFSFESALLDGMLQLSENPNQNILVGAADEITNTSHELVNRFGILKRESTDSLKIFDSKTKGSLHGEGSAWFVLSGKPKNAKIKVDGVTTFFKPENIGDAIREFLSTCRTSKIDFVLSGKSGDVAFDSEIEATLKNVFPTSLYGAFKHLCGEYFTSSSFALWLAHSILKNGIIPPGVLGQDYQISPQNVLIYNRYLQDHHSLILVSKE
jgi:3-oxoacyl-(acyl-carrier-protein) synthase